MDSQTKPTSALFQVYLRLRPPPTTGNLYPVLEAPSRFLSVEEVSGNEGGDGIPTHITLNPPNDNRRRAIEKFAFTQVFTEQASQLDMFHGTGVLPLVQGVLGPQGGEGRDGLLATLGVTGSGKSHTILGSRSQRGLTQLALDVLFRSVSSEILDANSYSSLHASLASSDPSEAQVLSAQGFFDMIYADSGPSRASSRAVTPMRVRHPLIPLHPTSLGLYPGLLGLINGSPIASGIGHNSSLRESVASTVDSIPSYMLSTSSQQSKRISAKSLFKGESVPPTPRRCLPQRSSVLAQFPDISSITVSADPNAQYAIVISMYEVYNDRIFDLLTPASRTAGSKDYRRRPLLYKHTEQSPDRKVVAGLRKIICGSVREALMVLEAGLHERRVAGTGSNSVSSRSHGFFCVEVKKRRKNRIVGSWGGNTLTIVDLAGSERARDAKTQGATLAEAGKINESLMYLGQCLQMQSDAGTNTKPNLVPYRQCKLTELLFSNSFPSSSTTASSHAHRNPQKAVMIVTADPVGDFNATSQILRYSALAREITVPRIPSVSSTILAGGGQRSYFGHSHSSPSDTERETMEIAALEIARMSEEIDGLRDEARQEQECCAALEAHLVSAQDRIVEVEQEVREECYQEMEARMAVAMQRWKALWESERERGEAHVDRKLEVLTRGIEALDVVSNSGEDKENVPAAAAAVEGLEVENARLRVRVALLQRELNGGRSPTKATKQRDERKRSVLGESREFEVDRGNAPVFAAAAAEEGMEAQGLGHGHGQGQRPGEKIRSPVKKVKKLTARKWDLIDADEML
ncbi:MAG: hypothetical protein M1818_006322 [Claussenomyces sp. TS43310]|nr:MAG: hypothetical protein M1818_006322 [Claussenomyces sp. TS43310]